MLLLLLLLRLHRLDYGGSPAGDRNEGGCPSIHVIAATYSIAILIFIAAVISIIIIGIDIILLIIIGRKKKEKKC